MSFISRIKAAFKSLPFPNSTTTGGVDHIIYPDINAMSAAVLRSISPLSQPSDDPNLSSLVAAGVSWLGSTLPEPDLQVKKEFLRKKGGKKQDDNVIERHPIYQLFRRPNPQTSISTLWKAFAYSWIISGNAYWIKYRNDFGVVVQIRNEPYHTIRARWVNDRQGAYIPASRSQSVPSVPRNDNPNQFINYYELNRDGTWYRIEPDDVVHFRDGEDPQNRRYGLSRLKTILREIYQDSAVASYAAELLGGSGVIPFVVGIDDKEGVLAQEDLENIKAKIIAQTSGVNARTPVILSARHTFTRTALTPQELDLRSSRSMAQDIFAAVTGLPAIVLNFSSGMERSIYHNMAEADRRAVVAYLEPLWWHLAQELTTQLLPEFDQDESHFCEFDLSEVGALKEAENERVTRVIAMYQGQVIKRSEARTELDYEVDPDGADDVYLVKAGTETVTVEEEQIQRDASIEAAQNPPPPPQPVTPGQDQRTAAQLALVKTKQDARLLKNAPAGIKELYSAR